MMSSGAVTLGDIAGKLAMLEFVCSRCERHGRLSLAKLIERHGADAQLTNMRTVLARDCPRIGRAIYEQLGVHGSDNYRAVYGDPAGDHAPVILISARC
jgi:lambda repressor-like predicted transcriptional regulator